MPRAGPTLGRRRSRLDGHARASNRFPRLKPISPSKKPETQLQVLRTFMRRDGRRDARGRREHGHAPHRASLSEPVTAPDSQLRNACFGQPGLDIPRIEANELAELEKRHSAFGHQSSNKALGHAQPFGQTRHIEQGRRRHRVRFPQRGHASSVARMVTRLGQRFPLGGLKHARPVADTGGAEGNSPRK